MTRRTMTRTALALVSATNLGCFGEFALTRAIYGFNERISQNQFVQSIVMWGLLIIPVYEIGSLVDLIILNPIELLTGKNPMATVEPDRVRVRHAGRTFELRPGADGRAEVHEGGRLVLRFGPETGDGSVGAFLAEDADGRRVARVDRAEAMASAPRSHRVY